MRFAYADPPYLGQCGRYGHDHRDGCWDQIETHAALLDRLGAYDGWALSMGSGDLRVMLPLAPAARVLAWVKPWASWKPGVSPAYAWEPVLLQRPYRGRRHPTPVDWIACSATHGRGLVGAKPEAFAWWLFACLGIEEGDSFTDLFPGSGAVSRAWERWSAQVGWLDAQAPSA